MAIDDNTVYGLTGAQVKELPGKIEAVKGLARELTTADYNYPTSNPTSVALWLLDSGVYYVPVGVDLAQAAGGSIGNSAGVLVIIGKGSTTSRILINDLGTGAVSSITAYSTLLSDGRLVGGTRILNEQNVVDNLASTSTTNPLSANQGKVLKDLVDSLAIRGAGAPTTSTVGQVGTLYEDTTNGDLYICTDATNPYVWEAVGGGSSYTAGDGIDITNDVISATNTGMAKELTTADYDYPTGSPTSVAAWLLAPGLYTAAESVRIRTSTGATLTTTAKKNFIILNGPGTSNKTIVDLSNVDGLNMGITMYYTSTSGSAVGTYRSFLTRDDVVDNLNSISDTNPLSANQGRILNNKISGLSFSTSELDTGATWIDGSTIYKKTFAFSNLTAGGDHAVPHNISNLGVVIKMEGTLYIGGAYWDLPRVTSTSINQTASANVNSTNVTISTGNDAAFDSAYVTLYYTKSS